MCTIAYVTVAKHGICK